MTASSGEPRRARAQLNSGIKLYFIYIFHHTTVDITDER